MGHISWRDQPVLLSVALGGWSVGVEPVQGEQANLRFGRLLLGQLDERTFGFTRAEGAGTARGGKLSAFHPGLDTARPVAVQLAAAPAVPSA